MRKIALFFGAGAECSYGLPSGGKFALDIFRMNTTIDKEEFKKQIKLVNKQSNYARWLPDDFENKKITAFAKGQLDSIVKSSLENKRDKILNYLNNFDDNVKGVIEELKKSNIDIDECIEEITGIDVGEINYSKEIKLNSLLGESFNNLFGSDYFSALLKMLELKIDNHEFKMNIRNTTRSILELLIGALGEDLIRRLNDGIFEKSPDTIDLFDDLGAVFTLDYKGTGMKGLELLIDEEYKSLSELMTNEQKIAKFGLLILEDIYSRALDYQSLIDANWRYIYSPKTDWAKFTKIIIFLSTVKRYISSIADENRAKIEGGNGFYHDILNLKESNEIVGVGTTNYNSFIEEIINESVYYLNGSVNDYYDPYLNKIVTEEQNKNNNHIVVPFLFTQSGVKPLTSVKMSMRYVEMFNKFENADVICVCGFAFNADDGHINGMFRDLIDDCGKTVTILHLVTGVKYDERSIKKEYQKKLRLENTKGINILPINLDRKNILNNELWCKCI